MLVQKLERRSVYYMKSIDYILLKYMKLSIREIEDFVETHLCKLCVILRSRALRVVCPYLRCRLATPLGTTV